MRIISAILMTLCLYPTVCNAAIITTNDFSLIHHFVQQAPESTLVIFDVDDVILTPKDEIFNPQNDLVLTQLDRDLQKRLSQEELYYLRSIMFNARAYQLVDPQILATLNLISMRKLQAFALTHCGTGKFGIISKLENWRVEQLKNLGINFSLHNNLADYRFPDINALYGIPLVKSGVIFTGHADKGLVLEATLQAANLQPTHIIFVDDKLKNIHALEKIAQKYNIQFTGFEYTHVQTKYIPRLNVKRAQLQFAQLELSHIWLSDQEADAILQKESIQY